ncbi:bifunctional helix-turn-helix domain-containing protein/methylated-DNA--[protein]-cysteine S-methyltransferase [Notoacmeibacter sp. MSK16QG-6]|uniref:methylated-DNA--[protein]-cysteine S-methyltransferase n=1 Tax=Notoacmeibacter sp. MSK16QG-6 TaxID=2957982 RepID=UPI00209C7220|nr:bifunctional helix-turn-helix domain-containing protein/methylated-DNA--[protein]-cysteine S-methyltransferase [Notoacmeibacter sp. MSK16QG-6]MCP1198883.1 bifunctional helix-turn-helix domain-containing protein/methylated-DNA--[protein]-cysteine S-methyltransferase [Notoacmeibacter sp. MSK16QG-6]
MNIAALDLDSTMPAAPTGSSDFSIIEKVIGHISERHRDQPSLSELAGLTGQSPDGLIRLFRRWAGLTPKAFLQAVTLDHARRLLVDGADLLDASLELGLSSPGRLHDLFVTHEAMSPGEWKAKGAGLKITYGWHGSPFGPALLMATDRGLCGLAFADEIDDPATFDDMTRRWPDADYHHDPAVTEPYVRRIFDPAEWQADRPLRIVLIGSDFRVRVWEQLLRLKPGRGTTYGAIAQSLGDKKAARAVGAAVGANPISFVVPCHRALGAGGKLTGYHWGLTRKRAILGWEAGLSSRDG